jgi:uncharacterized protein YjdB
MPSSQGTLKPFITVNRSAELYNSVSYPAGGNVSTTSNALFKASFQVNTNVIYVTYVTSGTVVPGMGIAGIGIPAGTVILGPLNQNGTGTGGVGTYTINNRATSSQGTFTTTSLPPVTSDYNKLATVGSTINGNSSAMSTPSGPGGIVGPVPGFNCVNIQDLRDYYNLPYPPATPLSSPPVIAVVSFGGGIYGQPVTSGQYAGFWKCTDISGNNGAPIQILVAPINGAINAPNADDGGATLENTVDVATVNAFYGMIDPRRDAPIYTPPVIILYIAPSSDISEMYRTFYTVLKNPVVCNGKSYLPSIVSCSWGAPEIAWTQKMPFPPNPSIPVDNDPNPAGIAEINEINDLFADASKRGINICCASGDIPLTNVNSSLDTFNYAQALLLQGLNGPGNSGQIAVPQPSMFPLTDQSRSSLPSPQVMFPSSSPYVTCVGGSAVYFPSINTGSYANPAEFAWDRSNGGISSVFTIPAYQQQLPGAAAASSAQFLASALKTANLAEAALGVPNPVLDPISGAYMAPNTAVTLATKTKNDAYTATLNAFNAAQAALQAAELSATDDALMNALVKTVKDASTALATAESNKQLANDALESATDVVVKTQTVSDLVINAGTVFGAAAGSAASASSTQQASLNAAFAAQQAAYNQLVTPTPTNLMILQNANQALQAAQAAAASAALAAQTLPAAVPSTTDIANKAVAQAAAAVVAPSLSSHPYLAGEPMTSPLVPVSNLAGDLANTVSSNLPYDSNASVASSFLQTMLGLNYQVPLPDASGNQVLPLRNFLSNSVTNADNLLLELVNRAERHLTGDTNGTYSGLGAANVGGLAQLTDSEIVEAVGQLQASGFYNDAASALLTRTNTAANGTTQHWGAAKGFTELMPSVGALYGSSNTNANSFASRAIALAKSGAANISSYQSGAVNSNADGYHLPCGLASAAASVLSAVYTVTAEEKAQDTLATYAYGSTDTAGGIDASGTFNGITPGLINLRNIYINTTLASRRTTTAAKAAREAKDAFLAWSHANDLVVELQAQATTLYNLIPAPANNLVREMDAKLLAAKTALSAASYKLGLADNYAVKTARLAHQSVASASVFMGNYIGASDSSGTPGTATFDQLGNLNAIPNYVNAGGVPVSVAAQGANNAACPAINAIATSVNGTNPLDGTPYVATKAKNALTAAQALIMASFNDNYLTTSVDTWNTHGVTGVDTSGNTTVSLTGTRLLVEDAQYAAAGAAGQVANVAFSDATESISRFTDWYNVALAANQANAAQQAVYTALTDASSNSMTPDSSGNTPLIQALNAISSSVSLLISATTPYNQQATTSATIATNDVVALAAKLENALSVCQAAQTAIQLAASSYSKDASGNFSANGQSNVSGRANNQGGSIFTVNMAYAKVTADAAQAACTAAAILAREQAVLAARRANCTAIALRNLVGEGVIGEAIAGFLDASGNLVTQTGYGNDSSGNGHTLPYTLLPSVPTGVNGYKPPSVTTPTVLYQGCGGIDFNSTALSLGALERASNNQPNIITNLTYTVSNSSSVYDAVKALTVAAQAVVNVLESDSSGNSVQAGDSLSDALTYPNVNAVNALDVSLGTSAVQACLLAAYEAQQWTVASANATFVTFSSSASNQNLVTFTPTLLGVANKLVSDADACLQTVLNAEGAIFYALNCRPKRVPLHDIDCVNLAAAFNANQSAADTYALMSKAASDHEMNVLIAFHSADLANALSPIAATAATAAGQAAALGAMSWSSPATNPNPYAVSALNNANFPAAGWGSAGMTSLNSNLAAQNANSTNPNYGAYNGTSTGAAPYPAPNASNSSRIQAPAHHALEVSSQLIKKNFSDACIATAKAAADAAASALDFNNLMVSVSTVTPSLVDAATTAASNTLAAAESANYATSLNNQGQISTDLSNYICNLLQKDEEAILAAAQSARANLEAIAKNDARYASRLNMVNLWNAAVDAAAIAVAASANAPTYYPSGNNPDNIVPASLGLPSIMGDTNHVMSLPNSAPIWDPAIYGNDASGNYTGHAFTLTSPPEETSVAYYSILSVMNQVVINAVNATTGCPDSSGNYRYIQFTDANGNIQTNMPENVNDTNQAYNNALAASSANSAVGNATISALIKAGALINAAYQAAVAVDSQNPPYNTSVAPALDASGNVVVSGTPTYIGWDSAHTKYGDQGGVTSMAVGFWDSAVQYVNGLLSGRTTVDVHTIGKLMSIVGINFNKIEPTDKSAQAISLADATNLIQSQIIDVFRQGPAGTYLWHTGSGVPTYGWPGYVDAAGSYIELVDSSMVAGQAVGQYVNAGTVTRATAPFSSTATTGERWGAYYFTAATMGSGNVAYETAYNAWKGVLAAYNVILNSGDKFNLNAANANVSKALSVYSIKLALQSAARAGVAGKDSATKSAALATSTDSYEDLAAEAAAEASYASTANLNMYRCVPDIAMHANADDLPVIFRLNGGNVYIGGTAVAASMFAGFLGVVQSHANINYFVNPVLYDNYTFPSPLFNDISGSLQVWYPGAVGGSVVPPRIANILPGLQTPMSGLGSGLYNCNVGLGSIKAMNLAALMEVPHLVESIRPNNLDVGSNAASVTVYPGTTNVVSVYVEPVTAYNPHLTWSISAPNAIVSQTNVPSISNNGMNDTDPYTAYNPLQHDSSGNTLFPTPSIGDYALGSAGNIPVVTNPFTGNPSMMFTATVTGVTAVPSSSPLPVITVSSTDGSSVYGNFNVEVLPAIQVTGVSISTVNELQNPSNTTLFLGTTLQLVANVTPLNSTNQRVYWWSSNTSVVNVDASGLLTSLAPGQVTIKATSVNNNISASISVYVPTPITGLNVLPGTITLNPNMLALPLKNLGLIRALVEPEEADYKHLTWEIVSSTQAQPAPVGITDVISLPMNGTVLARDSSGDITDNTQASVTALSNGTAVIKVSTYGEPYGVYGTYTSTVTVNVVTPITDVVMENLDMVINLNPHTAEYDSSRSLPESYKITATLKPAYPSNMNVFWSSSNPKVAVVSNNSPAVLNTVSSDPNFGLWQITETITPLSNGTAVIKVTTADGCKTATTTVVVTTPVTGLAMSAMPVTLNPNKYYTLQATVLPTTATNRALVWESTNTAVATVDSNGVVKAITSGSCGISATTVDGDFSAISQVNVVTPLVGVQLMVNTPLPIHINDVVQILVVMVPTTASNQQFSWTVTDGVDGNIFTTGPPQNGNIVYLDAVQAGNSVFTVTTADGNKQASINLQVVQW